MNTSLSALMAAMAAEPWRWDFFQALRSIDARHTGPRLGTARRPADEPVRLGQAADMSFAPASLAAVMPEHRNGRPRIEVRFFGLFGPNGPLPLHLTAHARERSLHKGDETFTAFADLFHHRLLLLFYRAWMQAQPAANMDRPAEDRFSEFVGSLLGVGGAEWRQRDPKTHAAKLYHAGTLSRQSRNADGLRTLLASYLRVPVHIEPFVGRWMRLLPEERSRLGRHGPVRRAATAQLGRSAVLGGAVFDRQHHFRIHIGPLDAAIFDALLPTGAALPAVRALVAQYIGMELGWDLHMSLHPDAQEPCMLGRRGRLGWTTWIGQPRGGQPPSLLLDLRPTTGVN